ncbi:MAG: TonB-dependent receptor [Asticcacaulis sp.]
MKTTNFTLKALSLTTALSLSLALAVPASAQTSADTEVTEIVVTGARGVQRSKLDTLAPVDVVRKDALDAQGSTELAQALSRIAPALTFPRISAVDGTDSIRPASLRGLSPDQTLVLVNGKRRHTSALVNVGGSAGRGSVAVDLNAIPTAGLNTIEVLRDGASAQYGSDAIAGVLNLRLREAREGGGISATVGQYITKVEPANSSRDVKDGETYNLSGWIGLPLGQDGFLTVSGEARKRNPTSRGDINNTVTPARVTSRYGDPETESYGLFANAGLPLQNGWSLYGFASYQDLDSTSAAFSRPANSSGNVPSIHPNGFLPLINAKSKDYSATGGVKGQWGDWDSDYSIGWGRNELDYNVLNSVSPSYGTNSKTEFYAGNIQYDQVVFNADISRPFDIGLYGPLTLALGVEARHETYKIGRGEEQSYAFGGVAGASPGSQGFTGFQPSNEVDVNRDNVGAYANVSVEATEKLQFEVAARAEHYSDFGGNFSGKLSSRYDFNDAFAVRGSVSTGFRAPSLAQQYFTSTASVVNTNVTPSVVIETGLFPATHPAAVALGATPLEAEKSLNYALGFVFRKGPFQLTVDGYDIRINDRIVLSDNTPTGDAESLALLEPYGVRSARFFTNGVTTQTTGVDIVANYRHLTDNIGRFDVSLALNSSNTVIKKYPQYNLSAIVTNPPALFPRNRQFILTNAAPENKATLSVDWTGGPLTVNTRTTYYGDVIDPSNNIFNDVHSGEKTLFDASATYSFGNGTSVVLGADNLFDVYPDATPANINIGSGNGIGALAFTRFSPFGFNGRYVYLRLNHNW